MDARQWRVTASNFGRVCNCRRDPGFFPLSLVKLCLGDYGSILSPPLQWGCTHEGVAIKAYEQKTGLQVHHCGIFLSWENSFMRPLRWWASSGIHWLITRNTVLCSTSNQNAKSSWVTFCRNHMSTNSNFWESLRKQPVGGTGKLTGEAKSRCICIAGCNHPNRMSNRAQSSQVYIINSSLFSSMTSKRWGFVFKNANSAFRSFTCFLSPSISFWYSRHFAPNCSSVGLDVSCAGGSQSSGLSWKRSRSRRGFLAGWE